jgi:ParB-like chromosome segregation protein Spo0J
MSQEQIEMALIDTLADGPLSSYPARELPFPAAVMRQLVSLSKEITQHGNNRPVVLVEKSNGRFELSSGEGRYYAHQILQTRTILAVMA